MTRSCCLLAQKDIEDWEKYERALEKGFYWLGKLDELARLTPVGSTKETAMAHLRYCAALSEEYK